MPAGNYLSNLKKKKEKQKQNNNNATHVGSHGS